jgi:hypothetical protein
MAGSYSKEERMKSVDRDFDQKGLVRIFWPLAYFLVAFGYLDVFARLWGKFISMGGRFLLSSMSS